MVAQMFRPALIAMVVLLTGCAGAFNAAVQNLPSVQNCRHVVYERTGNQVNLKAECEVPLKNDSLLDVPGVP